MASKRKRVRLPGLENSWHAEYKRYLRSEQWKALRARVILRDKYCRVCGSPNALQVHHVFYPPDLWKDDCIEHKTLLCGSCHLLFEMAKKLDRNF